MKGWEFAHQGLLWTLLAIPLLWWRARNAQRPLPQWTGALAIWRRVAPQKSPAGSAARRELPWSLVALLLAVSFAILALAGPRRTLTRPQSLVWNLVLDRSPSMFLPAPAGSRQDTRIARAVELALALCEESAVPAQAREWSTYAFDGLHSARGLRPPSDWLEREWEAAAETPWQQLDTPGRVWISDCEPDFVPLNAGLVQSGATAIPGPISDLGSSCLFFDGEQIREQPWDSARAGLFLGTDLPADVVTLAKLWAHERQIALASRREAACLSITRNEGSSDSKPAAGKIFAGGWAVDAEALRPSSVADLEDWADFQNSSGARFPAVLWRPGTVVLCLTSISGSQADPAVFALAWAELFEAARLPDPGLMALSERRRTAPQSVRAPAAAQNRAASAVVLHAAPWFALLASLLVLAGVALSLRVGR